MGCALSTTTLSRTDDGAALQQKVRQASTADNPTVSRLSRLMSSSKDPDAPVVPCRHTAGNQTADAKVSVKERSFPTPEAIDLVASQQAKMNPSTTATSQRMNVCPTSPIPQATSAIATPGKGCLQTTQTTKADKCKESMYITSMASCAAAQQDGPSPFGRKQPVDMLRATGPMLQPSLLHNTAGGSMTVSSPEDIRAKYRTSPTQSECAIKAFNKQISGVPIRPHLSDPTTGNSEFSVSRAAGATSAAVRQDAPTLSPALMTGQSLQPQRSLPQRAVGPSKGARNGSWPDSAPFRRTATTPGIGHSLTPQHMHSNTIEMPPGQQGQRVRPGVPVFSVCNSAAAAAMPGGTGQRSPKPPTSEGLYGRSRLSNASGQLEGKLPVWCVPTPSSPLTEHSRSNATMDACRIGLTPSWAVQPTSPTLPVCAPMPQSSVMMGQTGLNLRSTKYPVQRAASARLGQAATSIGAWPADWRQNPTPGGLAGGTHMRFATSTQIMAALPTDASTRSAPGAAPAEESGLGCLTRSATGRVSGNGAAAPERQLSVVPQLQARLREQQQQMQKMQASATGARAAFGRQQSALGPDVTPVSNQQSALPTAGPHGHNRTLPAPANARRSAISAADLTASAQAAGQAHYHSLNTSPSLSGTGIDSSRTVQLLSQQVQLQQQRFEMALIQQQMQFEAALMQQREQQAMTMAYMQQEIARASKSQWPFGHTSTENSIFHMAYEPRVHEPRAFASVDDLGTFL